MNLATFTLWALVAEPLPASAGAPPKDPPRVAIAAWDDEDDKPRANQSKLCKIADPDCEACQ